MDAWRPAPCALREPALRTTVTVHYQTVRHPSQRSVSAAALQRHAEELRAALTADAAVLAAEVDATALPGGASVYVDVTMTGPPLEVLPAALATIRSAVTRAGRTPEAPHLEESTVLSVHADRRD